MSNSKNTAVTKTANIEVHGNYLEMHSNGMVFQPEYTAPSGRRMKGRFRRIQVTQGHIKFVSLWDGHSYFTAIVSRLMARAFFRDFDESLCVDHINGNPEDNRIENLRQVTNSQNLRAFQTKRKGCSSKYRGVSFRRRSSTWTAHVTLREGKIKQIGYYESEIEAAIAWNKRAVIEGYSKEALNVL